MGEICPRARHRDVCTDTCIHLLMLDVLDLVNRLQAKNKELDDKLVIHKGTIDWQAKEINRQKQQLADERAKIEICAETISRQDAKIEQLERNFRAAKVDAKLKKQEIEKLVADNKEMLKGGAE